MKAVPPGCAGLTRQAVAVDQAQSGGTADRPPMASVPAKAPPAKAPPTEENGAQRLAGAGVLPAATVPAK
eukprot:12078021-Alexandrium_andersonii.AAC.1